MIKSFFLKNLDKHASKWVVLAIDIIVVMLNFLLAYVIRFGISGNFLETNILSQLPIILVFSLTSFIIIGSYKGIIRQAGMKDAYNLFIAVTMLLLMSSLLVFGSRKWFLFSESYNIPLSIIDMHYLLNIITLVTSRLIFKYCYYFIKHKVGENHRIMIFGAGNSGITTLSVLANDDNRAIKVVGFLENRPGKIGKTINGIKVYNAKNINEKFISKNDIDEIIISDQSISKKDLFAISDSFLKLGLKIKIVPSYEDWNNGELNISQIKPIEIEDLLERPSIDIQNESVVKEIKDKIILITGAAGSIGSEIVRQLTKYDYKKLVLVDQSESSLYDLQQELISKGVSNFEVIIGDVSNYSRMELIFYKYTPNMVFHAAAYKHVPLMESYPSEAVQVNVLGTHNLANLSDKYDVNKFVFISTDKAVNPTNVMGATKRVAEMYIQCLQKRSNTKFITTRFGNVLGSNGSVIPLFKKQIEKGGPITVTHKDITRYFMTIPEASKLVVEAGTMGKGGEIFIFDMGKSVKIFDLAKKMIHLSGLNYPEDIDIKITGLRSGEKLYEELLANTENTMPTYHKKIMISKNKGDLPYVFLKDRIDDLCTMDLLNHDNLIVSKIKEIVPEYISKNSVFENIDKKKKKYKYKELIMIDDNFQNV